MAKRKGKGQRSFYDAAKSSSRSQYEGFIRSTKADDPSEEILADFGNNSGQVVPLLRDGRNLILSVPPASPSHGRISSVDMMKLIFGGLGILALIVGILWGAFAIVHDVEDVEKSLAGIKTEMKTISDINNGMKAIQDKLDGQDSILNELLQQKKINEIIRKQSSKSKLLN